MGHWMAKRKLQYWCIQRSVISLIVVHQWDGFEWVTLCVIETHTTSIVAFALYAGPEWLKHPAWHSTTLNTQTEIIVRHFDWWKANHSKRPIRLMTNSEEWMWRSLQLSGPTFLDWNNCPLPVTDSQIYSIIIQSLWYDCFDFVDFILGCRLFNHLFMGQTIAYTVNKHKILLDRLYYGCVILSSHAISTQSRINVCIGLYKCI